MAKLTARISGRRPALNILTKQQIDGIERILVIKMSAMGDIAMSIPTITAIKTALPHVSIAWVVRHGLSDLLVGNPSIDNLIVAPRGLAALKAVGPEIRRFRPNIVLDMQGLSVSSLLGLYSGAKLRYTWETSREISGIISRAVIPTPDETNAVECLLNFARLLGVTQLPSHAPSYLIDNPELNSHVEGLLDGIRAPIVGMHIGASIANKSWPAARWVELIQLLSAAGLQAVLFGANAEREAEGQILAQVGTAARSLVGKTTPRQLAAAIAKCGVFVGGDTGATHIAALVRTPVVALMGPTPPAKVAPYGPTNEVIYLNLACSPCFRHPTCGGRYMCMSDIDAERVFRACTAKLAAVR